MQLELLIIPLRNTKYFPACPTTEAHAPPKYVVPCNFGLFK